MEGLEGFDWGRFLERADGVTVTNDANAALLGEVWQGAARGRRPTPCCSRWARASGGAVLADGRLLRGAIGRAGHLGHISLDPRGPVSILRTPGAIEELMGECSLGARTGGRFQTTRALLAAAEAGDAEAAEVWATSIRALACAIASCINVLDPEIVILGGGITEAGDRLWRPLAARDGPGRMAPRRPSRADRARRAGRLGRRVRRGRASAQILTHVGRNFSSGVPSPVRRPELQFRRAVAVPELKFGPTVRRRSGRVVA